MLRITAMTQYQAYSWLCRFDPEAEDFWKNHYEKGNCDLREDVFINIRDFSGIKDFYGFDWNRSLNKQLGDRK